MRGGGAIKCTHTHARKNTHTLLSFARWDTRARALLRHPRSQLRHTTQTHPLPRRGESCCCCSTRSSRCCLPPLPPRAASRVQPLLHTVRAHVPPPATGACCSAHPKTAAGCLPAIPRAALLATTVGCAIRPPRWSWSGSAPPTPSRSGPCWWLLLLLRRQGRARAVSAAGQGQQLGGTVLSPPGQQQQRQRLASQACQPDTTSSTYIHPG